MRTTALTFVLLLCVLGAGIAQDGAAGPSISTIQGAGHRTAYHREDVQNVIGVVTAVVPGDGFYMESPEPDDDPATSEGIYVEGYRLPTFAPGDLVRVSGRAEEEWPGGPSSGNLPITKIRRASVEVIGHDHPLPPPVVIGIGGRRAPDRNIDDDSNGLVYESVFDPENDALDFYESLESMRVQINDAVSVGTVHTAYGEIFVLPDNGSGASVRTDRGGIVVREGDFNPERVLIDYLELPAIYTQDPVVLPVVGDRFTAPIVGVLSYSYGNFKVRPIGQLPDVVPQRLPREVAGPATDPGVLSVATFNVYNLSPRDEQVKFDDIAETIVTGIASPDIVVLEEMQDGDGPRNTELVSADLTAQALLEAIGRAGGPDDYRYVEIPPVRNRDGGEPGANIRVGFLYRAERVELVERPGGDSVTEATIRSENGRAALYPSPGRVAPESRAFAAARKPLVAEFRFGDKRLFVIGNHLSSKGGDGYVFGHYQPPTFSSEVQRAAQGEEVRAFVEQILAADPQAYVIVAGDLNDFVFTPPLRALQGEPRVLLNLAEELLPEKDIYSYIYEGNSQALDHILVSRALFEDAAPTVRYVHRYAEFLYEERYSDHDPVLARFKLR